MGTFFTLPLGKPQPVQWVYSELHVLNNLLKMIRPREGDQIWHEWLPPIAPLLRAESLFLSCCFSSSPHYTPSHPSTNLLHLHTAQCISFLIQHTLLFLPACVRWHGSLRQCRQLLGKWELTFSNPRLFPVKVGLGFLSPSYFMSSEKGICFMNISIVLQRCRKENSDLDMSWSWKSPSQPS